MASPSNDESLYPIAVLIDELRDDDVAQKLNSIKRLGTIAMALGDERTRSELLPYLLDSKPEEDEMMVALAAETAKLVPLVGGPQYAHTLVPLLEELARQDETVVREEAVRSIQVVGKELNTEQVMAHLVPAIKRLRQADWFTSRVSVCGMFAVAYPKVDADTKAELRTLLKELSRDDTPMVRRAVATHIGAFAGALEPRDAQATALPILQHLLGDDQESVRKLALECVPDVVRALAGGDAARDVLDLCCGGILKDASWRVRHAATQRLPDMAAAFGPELAGARLVKPFVERLQDVEPEVRAAAAEALGKFTDAVPLTAEQLHAELMPPLRALAADGAQPVRVALATAVLQMAPKLGPADSAGYLELIVTLLKDKVPDVRLNVISHLEHAQALLGAEALKASVLPAIDDLALDPHWRVRHAVIGALPLLARQLGVETYEERLLPRSCEWLHDPVATIRDSAMASFVEVAAVFGEAWAAEKAVPMLLAELENPYYLFRITCIQAVPKLLKTIPAAAFVDTVAPPLLKAADDRVPNVKFNLCKVLQELAPALEPFRAAVTGQVVPILKMLQEDVDTDVRFYADEARQHYTE